MNCPALPEILSLTLHHIIYYEGRKVKQLSEFIRYILEVKEEVA
jgi:hypothetical protein